MRFRRRLRKESNGPGRVTRVGGDQAEDTDCIRVLVLVARRGRAQKSPPRSRTAGSLFVASVICVWCMCML
jgi:hypothetical protein